MPDIHAAMLAATERTLDEISLEAARYASVTNLDVTVADSGNVSV